MENDKPGTGEKSNETLPGADSNQQITGETPEQLRDRIAKMEAALKDANKEAASRRKRLEELEKAENERQEASKTEAQKLNDRAAKAEAERDAALVSIKELALRNAVTIKASKLKFTDPGDALAFLDRSKITVKDDGTVEGLDDALEVLVKNKPYLVSTSTGMLPGIQPQHGGGEQGETTEQKRKRLYGGLSDPVSLGGGFIKLKE